MISLIVLVGMVYACGYLVMIFHWHGGLPGLTVVFPSIATSWIGMVLWVFSLDFSNWYLGSLWMWVELLVSRAIG